MSEKSECEIWRMIAIEENDRLNFWIGIIQKFIEYQHGRDSSIGIGMKRLSEIMVFTNKHPKARNVALEMFTTWAMANMWKVHVELSNSFADIYHAKRIKNLARDMVNTVAQLERMKNNE